MPVSTLPLHLMFGECYYCGQTESFKDYPTNDTIKGLNGLEFTRETIDSHTADDFMKPKPADYVMV